MGNQSERKKHTYKILRRSLLISLGLLALALLVVYIAFSQYYKEHFYVNTFINEKDCSNLSLAEANEVINNNVTTYVLTIKGRDGYSQQISGQDIDLKYIYEKDIDKVLEEQGGYTWIGSIFSDTKVQNPYETSYDKDKLADCIKNLDCLKSDTVKEPENAKISDYDETSGFTIIKETQGNKLDEDKVVATVQEAIDNMAVEVNLDEDNCYEVPEITSDNAQLNKTMQTINTYMQTKLTYTFGDKTEVLDKEKIGPAIQIDEDDNVTIDEDKIKEFVSYLGETYDKQGGSWNFDTSYGKSITVKGGNYGWSLDEDSELEEVLECIKTGEQKAKEPVAAEGSTSYTSQTIGDTYVEINIDKQHMYFYKNGELVLESDVVTGRVSNGHDTPTGVYYLRGKQKNKTLKGYNDDGSKYSSFVSYWMPFNGGIGLHDATWQPYFGGSRYIYHGSHGCINMPKSAAKALYEAIEVYTPVVVY